MTPPARHSASHDPITSSPLIKWMRERINIFFAEREFSRTSR